MSYSEEEKAFHLQRMWAEGLTCGGAWRLYGGPNRETLRKWERAWERGEIECERPRVPGACAHEKHAKYPEETRREALRLLAQGVFSQALLAEKSAPSFRVSSRKFFGFRRGHASISLTCRA